MQGRTLLAGMLCFLVGLAFGHIFQETEWAWGQETELYELLHDWLADLVAACMRQAYFVFRLHLIGSSCSNDTTSLYR